MRKVLFFLLALLLSPVHAENVVNVYAWPDDVSDEAIQQFQRETGIKVNLSNYDSNEALFDKLRISEKQLYDVIEPSSYYVSRMMRLNMLQRLDKSRLPNIKNIAKEFADPNYDPNNQFSVPNTYGQAGIFINRAWQKPLSECSVTELWQPRFRQQLLLPNDPREVFALALRYLGYSINERDPKHIFQAYLLLKKLMPNVRLFNNGTGVSLMVDEDITAGVVWGTDFYRARMEGTPLTFCYPKEGGALWVDTYAIPKNAPHLDNAYRFLNFMLRAEVAKRVTETIGLATANRAGRELLPANVRNDPYIFLPKSVIERGEFQADLGNKALLLYENYWQQLKLGG